MIQASIAGTTLWVQSASVLPRTALAPYIRLFTTFYTIQGYKSDLAAYHILAMLEFKTKAIIPGFESGVPHGTLIASGILMSEDSARRFACHVR